jgi:osmotically-inducible protein OsmY
LLTGILPGPEFSREEKMAKRGRLVAVLMCMGLVASGCGREDADRLARVGNKTVEKLEGVTAGARGKLANGWQAMRGSLSESTPDSRVDLRLRWDKQLAGAGIRVFSPSPGVVALRGEVVDVEQQRRAVGIAESTQGVEKVIDELVIPNPR